VRSRRLREALKLLARLMSDGKPRSLAAMSRGVCAAWKAEHPAELLKASTVRDAVPRLVAQGYLKRRNGFCDSCSHSHYVFESTGKFNLPEWQAYLTGDTRYKTWPTVKYEEEKGGR
jgi:hypothetical protein